jgi:small subunit ribosomal protein S2
MQNISIRELLEAGCHFGHQTRFWHPKMAQYIYGARNKIHIINLEKTAQKLQEALNFLQRVSANNGKILFVGTKRSSREVVEEEAQNANCFYVNQRWLGGTLTNFKTLKSSIKKFKQMNESVENNETDTMTKKEQLLFERERTKLSLNFNGIHEMNGYPDVMVVVDVGHHKIAIAEAKKLGIPIIGVVDTNCSPEGIDYVIPSNDDSTMAIACILKYMAGAIAFGRENATQELLATIRQDDAQAEQDGQSDVDAPAETETLNNSTTN